MTLEQFAIAVGADTKWIKNAAAAVRLTGGYTEREAMRLGLARVITATGGIPLMRAYVLAGEALAGPHDRGSVISEAPDGSVRVTVDLTRYLSTFGARLALARKAVGRDRGRPPRGSADPIAHAREYGIDISLLQSNLQRTPEERLRIASANAEFIRRFRGSAAR